MNLFLSIIIPVYNRPEEVHELLESFLHQTYQDIYEILIVEDGSDRKSDEVVKEFTGKLPLHYFSKENTGPGDSRNFGMSRANGNYFVLLDSDCIVPNNYLSAIAKSLNHSYVDCFGGPDTAHASFSNIQKAINYAMTSWLTTGGIRGHKNARENFQPRSFNMGLSKEAFEKSGGFGNIHPGEDPDLSLRLRALGMKTKLIPEAVVFHKRRINFKKFYQQVRKFGMVRPILNKWHPSTSKITYWFPSVFCIGLVVMGILLFVKKPWGMYILGLYTAYIVLLFLDASLKNRSLVIGLMGVLAVLVQFVGYGSGFLKSIILTTFSKKEPQLLFPNLFFDKK